MAQPRDCGCGNAAPPSPGSERSRVLSHFGCSRKEGILCRTFGWIDVRQLSRTLQGILRLVSTVVLRFNRVIPRSTLHRNSNNIIVTLMLNIDDQQKHKQFLFYMGRNLSHSYVSAIKPVVRWARSRNVLRVWLLTLLLLEHRDTTQKLDDERMNHHFIFHLQTSSRTNEKRHAEHSYYYDAIDHLYLSQWLFP